MRRTGHTLVELITVVLILSILACIAVPRLNLAAATGVTADAAARQIVTDLSAHMRRRHPARRPESDGVRPGDDRRGPYEGYRIIDLRDSAIVAAVDIPAGIRCDGGRRFEFGPLGNLRNGSDAELRIATDGKTYVVEVVPATGAVQWVRR